MANIAIMRVEKLKGGSVGASLDHNFRKRPTTNANADRRDENQELIGENTDQVKAAIQERISTLPKKPRKDAVRVLEYVMTASPEWMAKATTKEQQEYFDASLNWLKEQHGAENVVCATIHHDELSPHMAAYVVPMTKDGRLCAKDFTGGKVRMQKLQDDYWSAVKGIRIAAVKGLRIERGVRGSTAKHQKVQRFYGQLESLQPSPIPELSPADTHLTARQLAKQLKADATPIKHEGWVKGLLGIGLEQPKELYQRLAEKYKFTAPADDLAEQLGAAQVELKNLRKARDRTVLDARYEAKRTVHDAQTGAKWTLDRLEREAAEGREIKRDFDQRVSDGVKKAVEQAVTVEREAGAVKLDQAVSALGEARESHKKELAQMVRVPDGVTPEEASEVLRKQVELKQAQQEGQRKLTEELEAYEDYDAPVVERSKKPVAPWAKPKAAEPDLLKSTKPVVKQKPKRRGGR